MTGTTVLLRMLTHHLQIRDPKGPTRVVPGPLKGLAWTTLPSYVTAQATSEGPWGLWLTQKNGANSAYGKIRSHLLVPLDSYLCLFSVFYSFYLFCIVDRKFAHSLLHVEHSFLSTLDRSKGTGFSPSSESIITMSIKGPPYKREYILKTSDSWT